MLSLYLLAAHLTGDFLLQNRWMARRKLNDAWWRTYHVAVYCVPFVPLVVVYAHGWQRSLLFFVLLYWAHWLTDSREFRSTVGDVIHWAFMGSASRGAEWERVVKTRPHETVSPSRIPPNLWPLVGVAVDQSLHVIQLAILGGLFLR